METLTTRDQTLLHKLEEAESALRAAGWNVVRVAVKYGGPDDTHFRTRLALGATDEPSEDHVVLDAVREIRVEWTNACHEGRLLWEDKS